MTPTAAAKSLSKLTQGLRADRATRRRPTVEESVAAHKRSLDALARTGDAIRAMR